MTILVTPEFVIVSMLFVFFLVVCVYYLIREAILWLVNKIKRHK